MDSYDLLRVTFTEELVETYREYQKSDGVWVIEKESRARKEDDALAIESAGEGTSSGKGPRRKRQSSSSSDDSLAEEDQTERRKSKKRRRERPQKEKQEESSDEEPENGHGDEPQPRKKGKGKGKGKGKQQELELRHVEVKSGNDDDEQETEVEEELEKEQERYVILDEVVGTDEDNLDEDAESDSHTLVPDSLSETETVVPGDFVVVDEAGANEEEVEVFIDFVGSSLGAGEDVADLTVFDGDQDCSTLTPKGRYCSLCCTMVTQRFRRHVEERHVPWWLSPNRACWTCHLTAQSATFVSYTHEHCPKVGMQDSDIPEWIGVANGALQTLSEALGCDTFEELRSLIIQNGWYPRGPQPKNLSNQQILLMWLWEKENGLPSLSSDHYIISPPNRVACLLHHTVLMGILPHLDPEVREAVRRGDRRCDPLRQRRVTYATDAHCHVDTIWDLQPYDGSHWDCPVRVSTVIANFVFPNRWEQFPQWTHNYRVYGTFGLHPTICQLPIPDEMLQRLQDHLQHPRCVALGEIGLDYTRATTSADRSSQRSGLLLQLWLKPAGLPVVLHCRSGTDQEDALRDTLRLLKGAISKYTPILFHCFLGNQEDRDAILELFPKTVFSFNPLATRLPLERRDVLVRTARGLQLHQLAVETDYPYLSERPSQDLYRVGEWLGRAKCVPASLILEAARRNVDRLFNIMPNA